MAKSTYELINEFRKEMNERFDEMKTCYITKDTYNAEVKPLIRDRDKIYWLVISSVIIAVLSIVLKGIEVLAK